MPDSNVDASNEKRGFFTPIGRFIKWINFLIRAGIALAGGWIFFSRLFVSHKASLPHALGGERHTFSMNGLTLSYYVGGMGRPLVLLHSINAAASAYEMKPIYEHFITDRRVFALDLPGFGFSNRFDLVYSPRLYTDAVLAFLQRIVEEHGPTDVIALSLGSEFATRAAAESPELFRSLTLISPTGFSSRSGTRTSSLFDEDQILKFLRTPLWSRPLYDLLTSRFSIRYFLKMSFARQEPDENLVAYAYLTAHQPGARYAPFYFISGKLFSPDIASIYDQLSIPVLVIHNRDPFTSFNDLEQYTMRPNWHSARIEDTRSLPHFERPAATNELLGAFLQDYSLTQQK